MNNHKCMSSNIPGEIFAGNILGAFSRALSDKIDLAVCKATDLGTSACYAIVQIGTEPNSSIEQLRKMLNLEHSSLVRLIDRLERDGYVERIKGQSRDKRALKISLTDDGELTFSKILDSRRDLLANITSRLSPDEMNSLGNIIQKIAPEIVTGGDDQHYVCRLCELEVCPQEVCPINLAHKEFVEIPEKPFRRRASSRLD